MVCHRSQMEEVRSHGAKWSSQPTSEQVNTKFSNQEVPGNFGEVQWNCRDRSLGAWAVDIDNSWELF